MKKIIIILIAVLLENGICFAQDSVPNLLSDSSREVRNESVQIKPAKDTTLQSQVVSTTVQPKVAETSTSGQMLFLIISVIILAALVVALYVFVFLDRRKRREMVIDTITNDNNYVEGHRLKQWLDYKVIQSVENKINMPKNQSPQSEITNAIESLRDIMEDFGQRLDKVEKRPVERPTQSSLGIRSNISDSISRREPSAPVEQKKLYALNIIDGIFNKVSEQISGTPIFELTLSSPNTASFTIYKGAYSTVLAAPEYLEGCDKQTLNSNPVNLQVIEGKASLQSDGKWKIIHKASVRLG